MVRLWQFPGTLWTLISLGLALAAGTVLLTVPSGTQTSTTATLAEDGATTYTESTSHPTLLQTEGWSVLIPLLVPVALALIALVAARRVVTITCAALALAFTLLGALTIGAFFLPASVALILAALRSRSGTLVE